MFCFAWTPVRSHRLQVLSDISFPCLPSYHLSDKYFLKRDYYSLKYGFIVKWSRRIHSGPAILLLSAFVPVSCSWWTACCDRTPYSAHWHARSETSSLKVVACFPCAVSNTDAHFSFQGAKAERLRTILTSLSQRTTNCYPLWRIGKVIYRSSKRSRMAFISLNCSSWYSSSSKQV